MGKEVSSASQFAQAVSGEASSWNAELDARQFCLMLWLDFSIGCYLHVGVVGRGNSMKEIREVTPCVCVRVLHLCMFCVVLHNLFNTTVREQCHTYVCSQGALLQVNRK